VASLPTHLRNGGDLMANWTETYRGVVPPWECDLNEHFTVSGYFDRLEEAEANLGDELGFGTLPLRGVLPHRIFGRFEHELRAGAGFHVESAVIGVDPGLRLGHRFVDSSNGEVVTWFDEHWDLSAAPLTAQQRAAIESRVTDRAGPAPEVRPEPLTTDGFIPTARGRVKPGDVDAAGHFALNAIVRRFSNASGQLSAAIGMSRTFMQQQRRGFSTFEQNLRMSGALRVDAPYLIETGIGHLGNSSLRMIHRMTDPRTGAEIARLSQYGVYLDLDARRPVRWPDDIRGRAAALAVPVS
jgi:acyl-CoA thioesterase FadM